MTVDPAMWKDTSSDRTKTILIQRGAAEFHNGRSTYPASARDRTIGVKNRQSSVDCFDNTHIHIHSFQQLLHPHLCTSKLVVCCAGAHTRVCVCVHMHV